jgi:hypothetical protein
MCLFTNLAATPADRYRHRSHGYPKGVNGPAVLVREGLKRDWFAGDVSIFRGRGVGPLFGNLSPDPKCGIVGIPSIA